MGKLPDQLDALESRSDDSSACGGGVAHYRALFSSSAISAILEFVEMEEVANSFS